MAFPLMFEGGFGMGLVAGLPGLEEGADHTGCGDLSLMGLRLLPGGIRLLLPTVRFARKEWLDRVVRLSGGHWSGRMQARRRVC